MTKRPVVEHHGDDRGIFTVIETETTFANAMNPDDAEWFRIGSVAVMTRRAGSVAAEHRHKNEGHTCHLVIGKMIYHERTPGEDTVRSLAVGPGESVFTPPDVDHAFEFLEDSVVVVVANIERTQEEYERDITRLVGDERLVKR